MSSQEQEVNRANGTRINLHLKKKLMITIKNCLAFEIAKAYNYTQSKSNLIKSFC